MRFQSQQSSCGAAALANATCLLFWPAVSEDEVIKLARTGWDGTSPKGIIRAAKKLGLYAELYRGKALPNIDGGWPGVAIMTVDNDEHWIAVAWMSGIGRYLIVDSADNELCFTVSQDELRRRAARLGAKKPYTAILVRNGDANAKMD